jgi:acyl carrier protein
VLLSIKSFPDDATEDALFVADLNFDSEIRKQINEKLADEFCVPIPKSVTDSLINMNTAIKFFASHPKAR